MLNLPFNTSVIFGTTEKPLRVGIFRPGFVLTLDNGGWLKSEKATTFNWHTASAFSNSINLTR